MCSFSVEFGHIVRCRKMFFSTIGCSDLICSSIVFSGFPTLLICLGSEV
jgi:hypothetical protein